jgi:hypothetical protein
MESGYIAPAGSGGFPFTAVHVAQGLRNFLHKMIIIKDQLGNLETEPFQTEW